MKFHKSSDDKWETATNDPSKNDLPRAVKRHQGLCGKSITPDEKCMLVNSSVISCWIDKNKKCQNLDQCISIFNEKCLINFDRYYCPGATVDYKRIEVGLKTQASLNKVGKEFLIQLGVAFVRQ